MIDVGRSKAFMSKRGAVIRAYLTGAPSWRGTTNGIRRTNGLALDLRPGEALGLRWKYLDQDAGEVRVWWQLRRTTWQPDCHKHASRCANDTTTWCSSR